MKAQTILNRLAFSGMMILLGVLTAVGDMSFQWIDQENNEFKLSQSWELTGDQMNNASFSAQKINLDSLATDYAVNGVQPGVYSLAGVVVSVQLVSNDGAEWQVLNTSQYDLRLVGNWGQNYAIPVTLTDGEDHSSLSATASTSLSIPAPQDLNQGWLAPNQSYTTTTTVSSTPSTLDDLGGNTGELSLDSFIAGTEGSQYVTVTTGEMTTDSTFTGPGGTTVSVNPNLKLIVTITYTVPEPGVLSLLVVGSAFLLRRRKIRLA